MCERFPGFLYGGAPVSSWEKRSRMSPIDMAIARGRFSPSFGWQGGGMSEFSGMTGPSGMTGMSGMMVADSSRTNLIVNYLPQHVTEKDLFNLFSGVGPVESCRIMRDYKTGYSYGFGFVNFVTEKDASNAIDNFNGYAMQNKRLKVSYARPSGDEIKETNLYVTNLPRRITEHQLETIFGKYGRIVQKHILRDKNSGLPRGVAFVRYDKREEAQEAISALNNVIPDGGTEPLCVKVAEEHGKQKAAYYAGWNAGMQHRGFDPEMFPPPQEMYPPPPVPNFQSYRMPNRPGPNFPAAKRPHPGGPIRKAYSPMQQPFNKSKLAILQQQRYFQGRNNYF